MKLILQGCSKTPLLKATWEHRATAHILKDKCGKEPKVATCEAHFCKISAKFGFQHFLGGEGKTLQASPSKGHLHKVAQSREKKRQIWPYLKHTFANFAQAPPKKKKRKESSNKPKFAKPGMNMQDADSSLSTSPQ